jgi:hypothetical protein
MFETHQDAVIADLAANSLLTATRRPAGICFVFRAV